MTRIHYPPDKPPYEECIIRPTIFLAGPIKNAPDWQAEAINALHFALPEADIVSPRTPGKWHGKYNAQVEWETSELWHAAMHGVIMFWLANSISENPARCYAQTTRFELGEWMTKLLSGWYSEFGNQFDKSPSQLVIGIEPGFSNEKYIRARARTMEPGYVIQSTLEDTCRQVIKVARDRYGTDKEMVERINYNDW